MTCIPIACSIIQNEGKYLLLKRSSTSRRPNLWEFPAGRVEENENIENAARRELREETNLKASSLTFLGFRERFDKGTLKIIFAFLINSYSGNISLSSEHSDYRWVEIEEIKNMKTGIDAKYFTDRFLTKNIQIKDFDAFIERFVAGCRLRLAEWIENISLVGSHSRGESTYPWSDIDIFVLVKSGANGKLPKRVLDIFNQILSETNQKGFRVWLKIKTVDEFPHSFSSDFIFNFSKDAKTLYGKDLKVEFDKEIKQRGETVLKDLIKKDAFEKRFWTRYYYTGITEKNTELRNTHYERNLPNFCNYLLLGQLVDNVIELCQSILFSSGIFPTSKKSITDMFSLKFNKYPYKSVPKKAALARYRWGKLSKNEMSILKKELVEFLEDACSRIIHGQPFE